MGWKPLGAFQPGDRIGLAGTLPIEHGCGITDAQIKLTAYLLGDGHLSTRKPANCYFCNSDPALIADFNRCVAELFGRSAPVDYQLHPGRQSVGYVRVGCLSEFNAWIDSHIQRAHSHDKVIPDWVDALSRDQLRLFIGTLWSTDGTFDTSIGHADYTSTSRRMIEQLQHLLLRLGIVALFNIKTIQYQGQPHRSYRAQITGREEMLKFYDRIQPFLSRRKQDKAEICYRMIRDKARNQSKHTIPAEVIGLIANAKYASGMTWAEIDQAVGMRPGTMSSGLNFKIPPRRALARHRVLNFATAFKSDELRAIADSEVFWDVIESIRPLGQMEVFDLTIPKHHNFIANDFIAHNCMGKKKPEEMAKQRDTFEQGALARGIDGQLSSHVFNLIEYFSGYGFNKCIVGETLVADPATGERRKVKEIYRNGIASVASLMPDHRMGRSSVVQVMENGIKPVFRLRTSLGKTLRATGNHPLLTASGWKRLDELKEGDRIASPSRLPIEGQERWSEHELITLGWVLSEGNTCHPSGFYFYNKDEVARDDFLAAASAFPDTQPTVRLRPERADTWCVYVGTGRDTRIRVGGGYSFTPRSGARLWLEDLGMIGHKAPDKHFPASVFRLDNACLAVLLGRLWSGDGYIASTSGKDMIPYLASASQRLAGETQHLLLRLGIVSRLTEKRFAYKDGRIGYTLHLVGRRSIEAFVQVIGPHLVGRDVQLNALRDYLAQTPADRESVDTLPPEVKDSVRCHKEASGLTWDQIAERSGVCVKEFYGTPKTHKKGFRRATIRKLADFFGADDLRQAANAEIFWERIVAIEPDGAAMTYDLEVDHTHNFVADDIIVHNSHSAAYALVSYQTLWLKAHYPAAFMAAVLSADMDNTDKVVTLIDECRTMKLRVDPPAINRSDYHFTIADDKTVVYGLGAVKGVGESAIEAMLEARRAGGSFRDLWDFCGRIDLQRVNRRVLESLIRAGALDELGPNRATLMAHLPLALKAAEQYHSTRAAGQVDLFGALEPSGPPTPDPQLARETLADWEDEQRLQGEKETLGLYLTGHPIDRYEDELKAMGGARIARLLETDRELGRRDRRDREKRTVVGLVVGVRHGKTQRGRMGSVVLDDRTGRIEATVFSELYEQARHLLVADQILSITGALNFDEFRDAWSLRADSVRTFEDARATAADHLLLTLDLSDPAVHARGPERVEELRAVLLAHRDTARETSVPIRLIYRRPGAVGELMLGSAWRVRPADALLKQLRQLLGAESVRVSYERPVQQAAMSELQSPPRLRVVS
ncbi:LAGLIDADG family homing endonuclease [Allochromatium vinosum]|nr:LAGLIDADG family homing endonuclease [Allochromatium vinosum]